jgi:hypothetical protein
MSSSRSATALAIHFMAGPMPLGRFAQARPETQSCRFAGVREAATQCYIAPEWRTPWRVPNRRRSRPFFES